MIADERIQVAVRLRPFNSREREKNDGCKSIVDMIQNRTIIDAIDGGRKRPFEFHYTLMSMDPQDSRYADQETVYETIGTDIVRQALDRYNTCIFTYGQAGSGKTYTMMGEGENAGIIPRLCEDLFTRVHQLRQENPRNTITVLMTYIEVVDYQLNDLLNPVFTEKYPLKITEDAGGVWVENLKETHVSTFKQIEDLIKEGNANSKLSSSHKIFCLTIKQSILDEETGIRETIISKITLVDLSSSDYNSLEVLERCFNQLAEEGVCYYSYRDSSLTTLLKEIFGGNCRTLMVATISPSVEDYEQTLATLNFAYCVKHVENHAVVNEDPNYNVELEEHKLEWTKRLTKLLCKKQMEGQKEVVPRNAFVGPAMLINSIMLLGLWIIVIPLISFPVLIIYLANIFMVFWLRCPADDFMTKDYNINNLAHDRQSVLSLICPWYEVHLNLKQPWIHSMKNTKI